MFVRAASTVEAEELLFAGLETAQKQREVESAGSIGLPLRVIVPSRSLRDHLARAWLRRSGRAQLGVAIQTHHAAALEVLERCGDPEPRGDAIVSLWAEAAAAREPVLRDQLGGFDGGLAAVTATVRDLLDAGYRPHHEEAACEVLQAAGVARDGRAVAVLRVAARVRGELDAAGLADRSALYERAEARLRAADPNHLLPSFGIWIYGFADATGVTADWLASLIRCGGARVLVETPRDPADPTHCEVAYSEFFLTRLSERTARAVPPPPDPGGLAPRGDPELLAAPGAAAELRAVATRIRTALDAGVAPEDIGVVARTLDTYRPFLRGEFERLGIPASTRQIERYSDARSRRSRALRPLLERRGDAPIDAWLGADRRADATLAVALHRLGAARWQSWVELDLEDAGGTGAALKLPIRLAAERSLSLPRSVLRAAQVRARRTLRGLERWPALALPAAHHRHYRRFLRDLGLNREPEWEGPPDWQDEIPAACQFTREQWLQLLFDALETPPELLGAGGGVQVMPVMAARSRRFTELFVLGLSRDHFPRAVREDPLLPDALRRQLRVLLPDLPIKARGRDEERHLFASLCGAAAHCTLSWSTLSDEGRELPVSPLVTRLQLAGHAVHREPIPGREGDEPSAVSGACDALEYAVRAASTRPRKALEPLWPVVISERNREVAALLGEPTVDREEPRLGRFLATCLGQLGGATAPRTRLGAFFGTVEAGRGPAQGPAPELFITALDQLLRCPWQRFLRRELRLEPVPDCLAELPGPSPRWRGTLVHRVLQHIVEEQAESAPEDLPGAVRGPARRLRWPSPPELGAIVDGCAAAVARDAGVAMPGFAALLARSVRRDLECARRLEWEDEGAAAICGAELSGSCEVRDRAGRPRRIGFRADRVDRRDGALCLVEYKTGRSFARGLAPATRLRKLGAALREGDGLQLPAYLRAHGIADAPARARLVFLREGLAEAERVTMLEPSDTEVMRDFDAAAATALEALDAGTRVPRLLDRDPEREPERCASCEVSLACLRGETGHRAALAQWLERGRRASRAERAAADLLRIPDCDPRPGRGEA